MSKKVKLTIDGVEFQAPEGMNLIDAAELAGIHIPNLCYLKGMKGVGACRLCLVEIEGAKGQSIACNTKVKEGMVVRTKTEEIEKERKFVIDLIVSMHPLDCMTCTKAGVCNLQKYAYEFEIQESSFSRKRLGHPVDIGNPFIKMSPDYCVLCGRCVRVCKEQGTNVLEFMGRGVGAKVTTVVDRALQESDCTFCGSCIDACPVNSIVEYDRVRQGREWDYEKINSTCTLCGNACDTNVHMKDGQIMKIHAGAEPGSGMKYICAYGRFGYDYLNSDARLTTPMKRVKGELVETTWKDALEIAAKKLDAAGDKTGIISVARLTNEAALTVKQFAKDVVKTKDVDTTLSLYATPDIMQRSEKALVGESDLVVLVGINPSQRDRVLPALNVSIRKKIARGGKLIIINEKETKLDKVTELTLHGDEAAMLKALIKAAIDKGEKVDKKLAEAVADAKVTETAEKAAEAFMAAKNPIIFASPAIFDAASNLSLIKGHALAVSYESNSKGVAMMGLGGDGKSYKELATKGAKVLYAIGEVPLSTKPKTDFLIVQNSHITELAKQADLLLPSATYLEVTGTIVDYKGRLRYLSRLVEPAGKAKPHSEIIRELAKAMGKKFERVKEEDVRKTYKKAAPKKKLMPFEKDKALDAAPEMILESVSASLLNSPRLFWLKETEKAGSKI